MVRTKSSLDSSSFWAKCLPVRRQRVAIILRIFSFRLRRLLHFLAVLVEAGQKKNLLPEAAPGAGDDVGDDLLVGVAEVRLAVDVINRRGDVKTLGSISNYSEAGGEPWQGGSRDERGGTT